VLARPNRLSIDVDIVGALDRAELSELIRGTVFTRVEEHVRQVSVIPKRHFKIFYYSAIAAVEQSILLDVLDDAHGYPELVRRPIRSELFEVDEDLEVLTPTSDGLLGDKLTAFAPNTVGILQGTGRSMEIIKQVFDIGELFDAARSIEMVDAAYRAIQRQQDAYRGHTHTLQVSLQDTIESSYLYCQSGFKNSESIALIDEMNKGVLQIQSHLLGGPFRSDQLRIALAKAAFVATAIERGSGGIDLNEIRFSPGRIDRIKGVMLEGKLERLNRLKSAHTEAFYYWCQCANLGK
jgi:hypothetical protein